MDVVLRSCTAARAWSMVSRFRSIRSATRVSNLAGKVAQQHCPTWPAQAGMSSQAVPSDATPAGTFSSETTAISPVLPLDHLRHLKEVRISIRSVLERLFMRQGLPQAVQDVFPTGICETLAALLDLIYTIPVRNLCHRLHVIGIQLVQPIDVVEDRVQVAHHVSAFFLGQFEVREVGDVADVPVGNFHGELCPERLSLIGIG